MKENFYRWCDLTKVNNPEKKWVAGLGLPLV